VPAPEASDAAAAREAVAANAVWYHTIELAPGVVTPGYVDFRAHAGAVLPSTLAGRALDVGTFDGFWAFEMEARGADVVAIDLETVDAAQWPPLRRARLEAEARDREIVLGRGFELAKRVRGSRVERVICNVYDLAPERIGGAVDTAFVGALLLHLRDPVGALERVLGAMTPGGHLLLCEPVARRLSLLARRQPAALFQAASTDFNWWVPTAAGLHAWVEAAGFQDVDVGRRLLKPPSRPEMTNWYAAVRARAPGAP
jgi:tRNA (mo5U34)-methyltransferase